MIRNLTMKGHMTTQSHFNYDKDMLYAEFNQAKDKDTKGKKEKYDNRIQFFKDHVALKKTNPSVYSNIDINFDNLLMAWQAPDPRDYFYKRVFGMSFAEKQASDKREIDQEVAQDRQKKMRKKETLEEVQLA